MDGLINKKRGDIVHSLLELINKFESKDSRSAGLLDLFMCGYGESYRKLWYLAYRGGLPQKSKKEKNREAEKCFYKMLGYLKRKGLVEKKKGKNSNCSSWRLTGTGKEKMILMGRPYEAKKDGVRRIVIFDIPETQRKKREWLREELRRFNFEMIQKSVWIGESALPGDFIEDLRYLGLLDFVNIYRLGV